MSTTAVYSVILKKNGEIFAFPYSNLVVCTNKSQVVHHREEDLPRVDLNQESLSRPIPTDQKPSSSNQTDKSQTSKESSTTSSVEMSHYMMGIEISSFRSRHRHVSISPSEMI